MSRRERSGGALARAVDTAPGTVRIKLCGLTSASDVEAANAAGPDYVGFVIDVARSRRNVTSDALAGLAGLVDPAIRRVGVFVDEPAEIICRLYDEGLIDVAQLHGSEDADYLAHLRSLCAVPIIQAFTVRTARDACRAQASAADLVLLDNGQGTGSAFDWSLVSGITRPYLLAGGLGPGNVRAAVLATQPWGVDMSSGIETDGHKDPKKMKAAVEAVRGFSEVGYPRERDT